MPSESVERKLTAILAADVAGYSQLIGTDEAGTARALREHRVALDTLVARHGGRVVKSTGDGVLLEFPSIVVAVECGLALQNLMVERNADVPSDRQMWFRIGINLGDVLIDGQDILGDGVNIAALRVLRNRVASAFPMTPAGRSKGRFRSSSLTTESRSSKTSRVLYGFIVSCLTERLTRADQRWLFRTSRRSLSSLSTT